MPLKSSSAIGIYDSEKKAQTRIIVSTVENLKKSMKKHWKITSWILQVKDILPSLCSSPFRAKNSSGLRLGEYMIISWSWWIRKNGHTINPCITFALWQEEKCCSHTSARSWKWQRLQASLITYRIHSRQPYYSVWFLTSKYERLLRDNAALPELYPTSTSAAPVSILDRPSKCVFIPVDIWPLKHCPLSCEHFFVGEEDVYDMICRKPGRLRLSRFLFRRGVHALRNSWLETLKVSWRFFFFT